MVLIPLAKSLAGWSHFRPRARAAFRPATVRSPIRLDYVRIRQALQYRASGLNLVVVAITLWNTVYLERAVTLQSQAVDTPLGWSTSAWTGDYLWHPDKRVAKGGFRTLRPRNQARQSLTNVRKFPFLEVSPFTVNGIVLRTRAFGNLRTLKSPVPTRAAVSGPTG